MSFAGYRFVERSAEANLHVLRVLSTHLRDEAKCHGLRDEMVGAVADSTLTNVAIDISLVEFMGSFAVLAFLALRREFPDHRLILCGAAASVEEMLRVCRLVAETPGGDAPFELAESSESALRMVN